MIFGLIVFLIATAVAYFSQVDIGYVIAFAIGAMLFIAFLPSVVKKGKQHDYQRANAENDLRCFEGELPAKIQQFKERKMALTGIYEGVSGDTSAF
ncbi:MAG: hypothetical protein FWG98_03300 [Candidatus Cloacimonetes bacterium]|nr:hypothetical protein [Candidatus Cloacimonadota bacterium]